MRGRGAYARNGDRRSGGRAALALSALALLGACRAPSPRGAAPVAEPAAPVDVAPADRGDALALGLVLERAATTGRGTIGRSANGRPIDLFSLGPGPETVLFIATIHGDEAAGTPLLDRLVDELLADPLRLGARRVLVVPVANPDGLAEQTRENARGVDLNRDFPAANRRGGPDSSEPESATLAALVEAAQPARVVSLHQPLRCVDWDGPAEDLARRMARACGLPARQLGTRPGSMGAWIGEELGLPLVTLELPRGASRLHADELWRRYGEALMIAVDG